MLKNKIKITCVISTLGGGGAEKIMVILTEGLKNRSYDVTLLTTSSVFPDFYEVPEGVRRIHSESVASSDARWFDVLGQVRKRNKLKEAILKTEPDLVISFLDTLNIGTISALSGTGIPVLVQEHSDFRYLPLPWHYELLRRSYYPLASQVVVLTKELADWCSGLWPRWKVSDIFNPVSAPKLTSNTKRPNWFKQNNLIAMGRLTRVKGFDILLKAFSLIKNDFPNWGLTILGKGELREELEELITQEGLEGRVFLPGTFNPPYDILKYADIFVMSSRVEGFPNALCEAMACGLPVISTDCTSGPRAIIREGVDGLLVPPENPGALAKAMTELMANERRRKNLAHKAPEVIDRFTMDKFLDLWENLIYKQLGEEKGYSLGAKTGGI